MDRRKVLKSVGTVTAGAGLSSLFGTVVAEEATDDELDRLAAEPNVKLILDELSEETLPGPEHVEKRRISDDELYMFRVQFPYGTLLIAEHDDRTGAMFTFGEDRNAIPRAYQQLPETDASLIGTEDGLVFRRLATEYEAELVTEAVDLGEDVEKTSVYTGSDIDGFRVDFRIESQSESSTTDDGAQEEQTETRSYRVYGSVLERFNPKAETVPDSRAPPSAAAFSVEQISTDDDVQTQVTSTLRRIIIDWAEGWLAQELSSLLGPCGPACTSCADWVVSLALDCRTCRPVCSTGLNPKGAIVCVLCVYAFCNDALSMVDCSRCAACLVDGEAPDDPRDDIWDALPSPPSLPWFL